MITSSDSAIRRAQVLASRAFDEKKLCLYREKLALESSTVKDVLTTVLDMTIYLDYNTFVIKIQQAFERFLQWYHERSHLPLFVLIDYSKIGSETWVLQLFIKRLLELPSFKGIIG